ncbi:MAG TPA: helix-turn-helix domain-containing protein [Candidatus Acidoferrales bacterium]|nr:helix-turn-helix domain-containing protein [Candidatus Acidoferrales bacterium]
MTPERIVEFAEGLAGIAATGGGATALAAYLSEQTGCRVLVEDAAWRRLAGAGGGNGPSSGREIVETGAPGTAIRLMAGAAHVGWLSLFDGAPANGAASELPARLAAAAIAVELARETGGNRGRRRSFWERTLSGAYHDAAAAREDAAACGIATAAGYVAIALEREAGDAPAGDLTELRTIAAETFRTGDADLGTYERGATLLVFVPAAREIDASNARTAATLLPKNAAKRTAPARISGGVGTVQPLLTLAASAHHAEAALAIGRRVFGPGRVVAYADLGAYPMLYEGAGVADLEQFARRELAPLRAYDEKHQTELERTLRIYFATGQNVKTAAAELNVHRHTVFYRLRQIAELCSRSLESPHDQLTLRLAVAIDALHSS